MKATPFLNNEECECKYCINFQLSHEVARNVSRTFGMYICSKLGYDYYSWDEIISDYRLLIDTAADPRKACESIRWLAQETEIEEEILNIGNPAWFYDILPND